MDESSEATVLIVEDEPDLADLYATWLDDDYTVAVANSCDDALTLIDATIDVVLLDRRLPGLSGDRFLVQINAQGLDCRVAMVTAVEPAFDIIDMGFDDYLIKPVSRDELQRTVERLLNRTAYDTQVREYFGLVSKKTILDSYQSPDDLATNSEYGRLEREIETLQTELGALIATLDEADFRAVFRDLTAPPETTHHATDGFET